MKSLLEYHINTASTAQITGHLLQCEANFIPPLSGRVDINLYAQKITNNAIRFEAWFGSTLVGLVAAYCNDNRIAYITSVSVLKPWLKHGIASCLVSQCIKYAKASGMQQISLAVDGKNAPAIRLYKKFGFVKDMVDATIVSMVLYFGSGDSMDSKRDYNIEIKDTNNHKYAYRFDFDVMHPFMLKSFEPFFIKGSLLELGSFKGDFTRRLLAYFDDVTCVEASETAIEEARQRVNPKVKFVNARFENANLADSYENIVLTHVLEHLDDPVVVLKRINDEWLKRNGRLFLVCPNANAPSRQIAVKMGVISHNTAVTPAEAEHGHRCTYTLDTLERDAVAAGLKVVHRSGIFFKALANFQWDKLLGTDIISKEYLEGCYKLGQHYPDLCSSIFLMCEKGD